MIIGLNQDSKIFIFNKFAEEITGYKSEEVMGKNWFDIFINNNDKENLIEQWNNITGKKLKNHEYMNFILAKNG
ncbi:MAG: PAS domain S-box protein, partial [Exilispira sp.]